MLALVGLQGLAIQQGAVTQVDVDVLVHGVESGVSLVGIVDEVIVV